MRHPLYALCPYFAMFPESFVKRHLLAHTAAGDRVFDPFSGRGTTVLQSLLMGRQAAGTDINPVAYTVSAAKAETPRLSNVLSELHRLEAAYLSIDRPELSEEKHHLPAFFGRAFYRTTLHELLFLRKALNWRRGRLHRFIAALLLGILHGEMDRSRRYLSNQLPRTISPKPDYSLSYWRKRGLWPKKKNAFQRLQDEARSRLSLGSPANLGSVKLADARQASSQFPDLAGAVSCFVTSPPYFDVTDYGEDQWLRLWFLGGSPKPTYGAVSKDDRHGRKEPYWRFLSEAWAGIADLAGPEAVLVCRLGGKSMTEPELTQGITQSLRAVFPHARMLSEPKRTALRHPQTRTFRPGAAGCRFEVDYVFGLGTPA